MNAAFQTPTDWTLLEGDAINGIFTNRNWGGECVYHLVMGGRYLTAGHDPEVAALRQKVLGDTPCTLADLRTRLMGEVA